MKKAVIITALTNLLHLLENDCRTEITKLRWEYKGVLIQAPIENGQRYIVYNYLKGREGNIKIVN